MRSELVNKIKNNDMTTVQAAIDNGNLHIEERDKRILELENKINNLKLKLPTKGGKKRRTNKKKSTKKSHRKTNKK